MIRGLKYRQLRLLAAFSGGLLLLLVALDFTELPVYPALLSLNPSYIVLIGLVLTSLWLMTGRGYRRLPFFLFFLAGIGFILISLEYKYPLSEFWSVRKGRLYVSGILLLLASKIISRKFYLNHERTYFLLFSLILSLAGLAAFLDSTPFDQELEISYHEGIEQITSTFSPLYRENEELKQYLKNLLQDDSLDQEEKELRIKELQERIAQLEKDMGSFELMKEENLLYERQIAALKEKIGSGSLCPGVTEDTAMVSSYELAVRPEKPCVRDFAVSLAKECPGSYYRSGTLYSPGKVGIGQIFTIHSYLAGNWKYINDPLFVSRDYYSPADRTLAVGFAGDCDDFAILMASCIEAVGGRVRIVHGSCSGGAHAWAEVYIGDITAWQEMMSELRRYNPDFFIGHILQDSQGKYWLSLDWQIGRYSCGNNPQVIYQSSY